MSVLYDYFVAESDDDAAAMVGDGLAAATAERLAEVARSWAAIRGLTDHQDAFADLLGQFAWLAREARSDGAHLYCWVGV